MAPGAEGGPPAAPGIAATPAAPEVPEARLVMESLRALVKPQLQTCDVVPFDGLLGDLFLFSPEADPAGEEIDGQHDDPPPAPRG